MEERILRCPNCGANATNHDNCEYCGSLLVRFAEKGIDLTKTTYLNDDATLLGLTNALKYNLQLQDNANETVVTDIVGLSPAKIKKEFLASILRSGNALFLDGQTMLSNNKKGLCIVFSFHHAISGSRYNDMEAKRLNKFKSLDCFSLFTEHISFYNEGQWKANEYYIDFGEDAEGASRMISKVLCEVYELSLNSSIDCYTNIGNDTIEKCRMEIEKSIKAEVEAKSNEEWWKQFKEQKKYSREKTSQKEATRNAYIVAIFSIIIAILFFLLFDW